MEAERKRQISDHAQYIINPIYCALIWHGTIFNALYSNKFLLPALKVIEYIQKKLL
jgi:hypothetical protein